MTTYDKIAAAVIFVILSFFPLLVFLGVNLTGDELAKIQVFLGAVSTAGGVILQAVQHKAPSGP